MGMHSQVPLQIRYYLVAHVDDYWQMSQLSLIDHFSFLIDEGLILLEYCAVATKEIMIFIQGIFTLEPYRDFEYALDSGNKCTNFIMLPLAAY